MTPIHQEIQNKYKNDGMALWNKRAFLNFSLEVQELSHAAFS